MAGAGRPRKNEIDKHYTLSGITIPMRDWNYVTLLGKLRSIKPAQVIREMIDGYKANHPIEQTIMEERENLKILSKNLDRAEKMIAESRSRNIAIAKGMCLSFLENHYGEKLTENKVKDHLKLVSDKSTLPYSEVEEIYVNSANEFLERMKNAAASQAS